MNTQMQQILAQQRLQTLRREADVERLASTARRASAAPRHDLPGTNERRPGVLRRLVARLAA